MFSPFIHLFVFQSLISILSSMFLVEAMLFLSSFIVSGCLCFFFFGFCCSLLQCLLSFSDLQNVSFVNYNM
ncbi:hypothetical protein DFS34DRAFT_487034 [Phlyctochytrium arcticum]|nr:hypothetical protein DFS34DRAFT_487034 [Phlyctochytrium arcticum]